MQVTLNALPASLAEFRNLSLNTPDEVVAGFLCALNLYVKNPNEGVEAMNILRGPRPMTPYDSQFLRDRLRGKEYLPLAYFAGATPQNSYVPTQPYVLNVLADPRPQDIEPGYLRVFIATPGADSPRPIKLRQKPSHGSPIGGVMRCRCRAMIKSLHKYIAEITTNPIFDTLIYDIGDGVGLTKVKETNLGEFPKSNKKIEKNKKNYNYFDAYFNDK